MNAPTAGTRHGHGSRLAYGAALWAFIFGALHVAWAAGWYVGLPREMALKAFSRPWFLVYDLLVAVVCLAAVPLALALVRPWGRRLPRSLVGFPAWVGTGLLVLRSGTSLIHVLYRVAAGTFVAEAMYIWEVWFYVGAILFGVSTWKFWAREPGRAAAV